MSNDSDESAVAGFLFSLLVVFVFGVTIAVSRCSMVDSIVDDCKDYGKFESNEYGEVWYECKEQVPVSSAPSSPLEK